MLLFCPIHKVTKHNSSIYNDFDSCHQTGFGPLTKTTNSAVFQNAIDSLVATGGGDPPEMSLSGLQVK